MTDYATSICNGAVAVSEYLTKCNNVNKYLIFLEFRNSRQTKDFFTNLAKHLVKGSPFYYHHFTPSVNFVWY